MGTTPLVGAPSRGPLPTPPRAIGPVALRGPSDLRIIARLKISEGQLEGSCRCSCGATELRMKGPAEIEMRCRRCGWRVWSEGQDLVIAVRRRGRPARVARDQAERKMLWRVANLDDGIGHASIVCCRTHATDPGRLVAVIGSRRPRIGDRFTCDDWGWRVVGEDSEIRRLYGESGLVAEPEAG